MGLLYKPFQIIGHVISGKLSKRLFQNIWSRFDELPPPKAASEASARKIVAAHALQAGVKAGVTAAVDHGGARVFHYLIGAWPAKLPEPEKEKVDAN
jgi:hypothetical protein